MAAVGIPATLRGPERGRESAMGLIQRPFGCCGTSPRGQALGSGARGREARKAGLSRRAPAAVASAARRLGAEIQGRREARKAGLSSPLRWLRWLCGGSEEPECGRGVCILLRPRHDWLPSRPPSAPAQGDGGGPMWGLQAVSRVEDDVARMDAVDGYGAPWPWGHCKPLRVYCLGVVHVWRRRPTGGRWFSISHQVADEAPQVSEALRQLPQNSGSDGVQGCAHLCFQSGRQTMRFRTNA